MADTQLALASRVSKWDSDFFAEYVRDNLFRPYMGRSDGNSLMPIVTKYELSSGGKTINMPLITKLKGSGVQGLTRLRGNEEPLGNYNMPMTVNWNRNAVSIKKPDEGWTEMDLRRAARQMLKYWATDGLRDDLISAMLAYNSTSILKGKNADLDGDAVQTPAQYYATFSEGVKDAFLAANSDRFLFGAAVSNIAANDHSAALANIDNTNDKLTTATASLAKELARAAQPAIRPFRVESAGAREFFVMFCNSRAFRDLKRDTAMLNANRDARPRDVADNPIFQDGDLLYDGIIFREIPEIPSISNGTIDCAPNFLCGAQAAGVAWGQEPRSVVSGEDDYGFEYNVGIEECRSTAKMIFNGKQHGMVTVWTAAVASA